MFCAWERVGSRASTPTSFFLILFPVHNTPTTAHRQALYGVQVTGAEAEAAEASVVVSRSHTGKGADVVTERLPGKTPVFAGGSGYKALRVLKVRYVDELTVLRWLVQRSNLCILTDPTAHTYFRGRRMPTCT